MVGFSQSTRSSFSSDPCFATLAEVWVALLRYSTVCSPFTLCSQSAPTSISRQIGLVLFESEPFCRYYLFPSEVFQLPVFRWLIFFPAILLFAGLIYLEYTFMCTWRQTPAFFHASVSVGQACCWFCLSEWILSCSIPQSAFWANAQWQIESALSLLKDYVFFKAFQML